MSTHRYPRAVAVFAAATVLVACTATVAHPAPVAGASYTGTQWGLTAIRAQEAWEVTRGQGVVVAVVDTGVDGAHPDLDGRVVRGWSVQDRVPIAAGSASDRQGHGTHVAGIIAGDDDGEGITGVAPRATIMPIRVTDAFGAGNHNMIAEGLDWAVTHGADVVNISMGGRRDPRDTGVSPVCASILRAVAADVVVVVSAGNGGAAGNLETFPAACPGALSVAAVDETLLRFATSIADVSVSVAAPGVHITSTVPVDGLNDPYVQWTGTSMAAPFVSGVAALARAAHPEWSAEEVIERLRGTANDIGPLGIDPETGYGIVDAAAVVGSPGLDAERISARIAAITVPTVVEARRGNSSTTVWWQAPPAASVKGYRIEVRSPRQAVRAFDADGSVLTAEIPVVPGDGDAITVVAVDGTSERSSFPLTLFDVFTPGLIPPLYPSLRSLDASWTPAGVEIRATTTGRRGSLPVEVRTLDGKVLARTEVLSGTPAVVPFAPMAAERATLVTVVVEGANGQQFTRLAPQFPISAKITRAGTRFVVTGSTAELCSSRAKGCAGSTVKLVDARTGRLIATTKVSAGSTYRMTVSHGTRSWNPLRVSAGSAVSPDVRVDGGRS